MLRYLKCQIFQKFNSKNKKKFLFVAELSANHEMET